MFPGLWRSSRTTWPWRWRSLASESTVEARQGAGDVGQTRGNPVRPSVEPITQGSKVQKSTDGKYVTLLVCPSETCNYRRCAMKWRKLVRRINWKGWIILKIDSVHSKIPQSTFLFQCWIPTFGWRFLASSLGYDLGKFDKLQEHTRRNWIGMPLARDIPLSLVLWVSKLWKQNMVQCNCGNIAESRNQHFDNHPHASIATSLLHPLSKL